MRIKKQDIISWLLDKNPWQDSYNIGYAVTPNGVYDKYLLNALNNLFFFKRLPCSWGIPEWVTSSFYQVMEAASKSFVKVEEELFKEFCENKECGILLSKDVGTMIYSFYEGQMYIWIFREAAGASILHMSFASFAKNGHWFFAVPDELHKVAAGATCSKDDYYPGLISMLMAYIAVKRHAEIETVIIPDKKTDYIKKIIPNYQGNEAIHNESGQEVRIMDSRWFREIVNNNTIRVRAFERNQRKKNKDGKWYIERITIESYERKAPNRKAGIQKQDEAEKTNHTDCKI